MSFFNVHEGACTVDCIAVFAYVMCYLDVFVYSFYLRMFCVCVCATLLQDLLTLRRLGNTLCPEEDLSKL